MTQKDENEFREYLRHCTNNQLRGVFEKERAAGRLQYQRLAEIEAARRDIDLH